MKLTAIIKKGEKQFVALCSEVDVVSQGYTIDEALNNLKEAVGLYLEEVGLPEGVATQTIVASFEVGSEAAKAIRA